MGQFIHIRGGGAVIQNVKCAEQCLLSVAPLRSNGLSQTLTTSLDYSEQMLTNISKGYCCRLGDLVTSLFHNIQQLRRVSATRRVCECCITSVIRTTIAIVWGGKLVALIDLCLYLLAEPSIPWFNRMLLVRYILCPILFDNSSCSPYSRTKVYGCRHMGQGMYQDPQHVTRCERG